MRPPEVLEGAQVRIRRSTLADSDAVFWAAADPEVMRFMDWPAHDSEADARDYLSGCAQRWTSGDEYHWIIEERAAKSPLGCLACRLRGSEADFGYFIARSLWGRGYATEAVKLLMSWLMAQPGILRIWASTDADNRRSIRLLERVGLHPEALLKMHTLRPNIGGAPRDTLVYALTRPAAAGACDAT